MKIPQKDKRYSITNLSDVSGNIWYTKNLDFDEVGYMKLSNRTVQIMSDSSLDSNYDTDFNIPTSIGRYGTSFYLATTEEPFKSTVSTTTFNVTQDADASAPSMSNSSRGVWWQNRWYATTSTKLWYKTISGGAWTDSAISLTTGITHPVEVFRNKNSLCVGNGNTVQLINTSHSLTITLTIPSDYEVVNISYSNNKVGIITKLSTTADGQNQDAFFYVWDGATTSANGGFPVGVNEIAGITPYKGSWVILSKTGQLLYFNGGGFQELAQFPFFVKDRIWSSINMTGDTMLTDGDLIYIFINGLLSTEGVKQDAVLQNSPGGIWCYDPNVGLYHKFSPSLSQMSSLTVADSNVNTTTNVLTVTSGTIPQTGNPIKLTHSTSTPIGGLSAGEIYYVIKISSTTFKLATTRDNAITGTEIDLTSTGSSLNYFNVINLKDYGQTYITNSTGGMVTTVTKDIVVDGFMFGFRTNNSVGTSVNYLGLKVPDFTNIGYGVTPKIESEDMEDIFKKIIVKYKPLKQDDTITIKYKTKEIEGIPTVTPQRGQSCTWVDNTSLTVTADFSEVESYINDSSGECELEIISGSGAGQMSKISSITDNAGTYTIVLEDEIEGVTASDTCNIIVDNWKTLGTITVSDDKGYKEFAINENSKFIKFKVILKGVGVAIEQLHPVNSPFLPTV